MKNYVFDANFVRKWNLNAGFETFVSKVKPDRDDQCRSAIPGYQFQVFYIDKYTYDVRMYNLGIVGYRSAILT